jgi:hypothetical protein
MQRFDGPEYWPNNGRRNGFKRASNLAWLALSVWHCRRRVSYFYNQSTTERTRQVDIEANPDAKKIGHADVRIPASFVGGPHYAAHKCDEILTCAAKYGVDNMIFVTPTFNDEWPIVNELLACQGRARITTVCSIALTVFLCGSAIYLSLFSHFCSLKYFGCKTSSELTHCLNLLYVGWLPIRHSHSHIRGHVSKARKAS